MRLPLRRALPAVLAPLLLALPACRTVRTDALAPSLEAAVAQARGASVRIDRFDGPPVVNATHLALSARSLVFFPPQSPRRDSLPREQVRELTVPAAPLSTLAKSVVFVGSGVGLGVLYEAAYSFFDPKPSLGGLLLVAGGVALNAVGNPARERTLYRAPTPPLR